eukprot:CAMPEP_0180705182 /NCGR_PEP_ID=MMETSP1038_2-20121128/7543_1 /TAXON_ID=632150 /ORGANISM="Azadinium spinosum, Strain 3D9" /LENGTH=138 /DNA_ID=CAMNT_0022737045 /DNA_START=169 /DNA_END=582 /DNA_ORIENTATION=+
MSGNVRHELVLCALWHVFAHLEAENPVEAAAQVEGLCQLQLLHRSVRDLRYLGNAIEGKGFDEARFIQPSGVAPTKGTELADCLPSCKNIADEEPQYGFVQEPPVGKLVARENEVRILALVRGGEAIDVLQPRWERTH